MNKRIDTHQHFWKFDPVRDAWIDHTMKVIQRDFFPEHLSALLQQNGFEGCVAVQAVQDEEDNNFLLGFAEQHSFIKGVVGWVDLRAANVSDRLEKLVVNKKLKGFRHVVQGEAPGFMQREDFRRGIAALKQFDYRYDILIYHHQLPDAIKLVNKFADQPFVLDHIAKPDIKAGNIDAWKRDITELARAENVMCKVSGMVTEADWKNWTADDLKPYLDVVFDAFGTDRLMFGSDWPVCTVAADYKTVVDTLQNYMAQLPQAEQDNVWFKNAEVFYKLEQ